jgi:hypothetical protein
MSGFFRGRRCLVYTRNLIFGIASLPILMVLEMVSNPASRRTRLPITSLFDLYLIAGEFAFSGVFRDENEEPSGLTEIFQIQV